MKKTQLWTSAVALVVALLFGAGLVCLAADQSAQPQWWGKGPGKKLIDKLTVQGTVANISPANIDVQTPEGIKKFTVTPQTRVMVRGQKATIADVKVGDPVIVRFQPVPNGVPIARLIAVPKPWISGRITAINGNVITVAEMPKPVEPKPQPAAARPGAKPGMHRLPARNVQPPAQRPAPGPERQIRVTDQTKYTSRGYVGTLADLRVGYFVRAQGTLEGDQLVAEQIEFLPMVAKGTVTAIENGIITVKAVRQFTVNLQPSDKTVVWVKPRVAPNKRGTLDDVKVGSPVDVGFHPADGRPSPLLWIAVYTGM